MLQGKLDQPISSPPSPRELNSADMAQHLSQNINTLREEVYKLRAQLLSAQAERKFVLLIPPVQFARWAHMHHFLSLVSELDQKSD